jgi:acetyltransferase-like isoleucine patch superfamily enzyme
MVKMFKILFNLARGVKRRYHLRKYDDFTIAEYFRQQGAQIGVDCRILIRELSSEPFLVRIGDHCTIAGRVALITHDGGTWVFTEELPSLQKFGVIDVRDNCFIGYGATVLPDVRIGPNSIVAAGAVVTNDVPPHTVVGGCPAKTICTLEEYRRKAISAWEKQRPDGYFADLRDGAHYAPRLIQARKHRDWNILRRHLERTLWNR